jgi:hypothetical protein
MGLVRLIGLDQVRRVQRNRCSQGRSGGDRLG